MYPLSPGFKVAIMLKAFTDCLSFNISDDFVTSLQRFKDGLKNGGLICIKDNVAGGEAVFDNNDSSVTR